jgi:phthiocerol/phenolphthiocerol synthesis type-I polyketide synthase C
MKRKIAVVGMSYRFPGTDASRYWTDLLNGQDLVTTVEPGRWAQETFRHPNKNHPGTSYTFAAGSIGDVSTFDAAFFGISPREAGQMDPQQRLLLEMSWEAFENAGIKPSAVKGTKTGVFIGISSADYAYRFAEDLGAVDSTVATGNTSSIAANRISYVFDLRGPSMALDTACSSSLVAFHQACQSIATGESTLAVTGGVSLHLHPYGFIAFSKASMLSRRGKCSVFDAAGDGYVRSEGGGIFVLKDYEKALADGDPIIAVVAASAVNSDGKKSGLTVPSSHAQATLLSETYAEAGIDPKDIDYIEAHGTGTAVGDPIETRALGEAIGKFRAKDNPLLIGSVKSNLGHLEAASGVAGLVKALHCVHRRTVPATIHLETPNLNIKFDEWNLRVAKATTPLKQTGKLIVGVNSFGFGGANAHVILESAGTQNISPLPKSAKQGEVASFPLIISGKTPAALKASAKSFAAFLRAQKQNNLYNVAYGAAFNRDWHEHRAVLFGNTPAVVADALEKFSEGVPTEIPIESGTSLVEASAVAFVYSGNGSQWDGMGKRLLEEDAVFRQAVRAVDQIFKQYADFSLEDELAGKNGTARYGRTEIAQPALFALQVGVTQMLRAHGLMPAAVAGHSVGEVAAAWAAGALTLEQAVQVIFHRSALQGETKGRGQMTAVSIGHEAIAALLEELKLGENISLAGVNSSRGVTVAGDVNSLIALEAVLVKRQITHRRLDLDYAFHSPAMDSTEKGVLRALSALRPGETQAKFYSTVTGKVLAGDALNATYWWHNIRKPVLFANAVRAIQADGINVMLEIGPHAILRAYMIDGYKELKRAGRVIPTLTRNDDRATKIWGALSQAIIAGAAVDWKLLFPQGGRFTELPTYPWQRESHVHAVTPDSLNLLQRKKVHPLLGYRLSQQQLTWENQLDLGLNPSMADHVVGDATVFPGSGFVELALAAVREWIQERSNGANTGDELIEIEELEIRAPLMLSGEQSKTLRVAIDAVDGALLLKGKSLHSADDWTIHAVGRAPGETAALLANVPLANLPTRDADFSGAEHVALTESVGLNYGDAFKAVDYGWVEGRTVWAKLAVPKSLAVEVTQHLLHPAMLDCTFQLIIHLMKEQMGLNAGIAFVPVKVGRVVCRMNPGTPVTVRATLHKHSPHSLTASFALFDGEGSVIAIVNDARFRSVRLRKDLSDHVRFLGYHGIPQPHIAQVQRTPAGLFADVEKRLTAAAAALASQGVYRQYDEEIAPLLDALCGTFAAEGIAALTKTVEGEQLSRATLDSLSRGNPETASLLARLTSMLVEDERMMPVQNPSGSTVASGSSSLSGYRPLPVAELPAARDIWNSLIADHPDRLPLLNAVGRIGANLEPLILGQQSTQSLLPRDGSYASLFRHTLGADARRTLREGLHHTIVEAMSHLAEGQRFRVIEIAHGAPLFATELYRSLDWDRCDYLLASTDTSTLEECERLQEKFPHLLVEKLLDVSSSTVPPAVPFDLVIVACDFDHEAAERAALTYAANALAPGGALALVALPPSRWTDFVFGGARTWWRPQTGAVLPSMTLAPQARQLQIEACGFSSSQVIELGGDDLSCPFLVVAEGAARVQQANQAARNEPPAAQTRGRAWILLLDDGVFSHQLADALARKISALGAAVVKVGDALVVGQAAPRGAPLNYRLNQREVTALSAMLADVRTSHDEIAGIVHLHGLYSGVDEVSGQQLLTRQVGRCAVTAALVQACEKANVQTPMSIVTAGAAIDLLPGRKTTLASAADSPLLGFARTLMNEPMGVTARLIDFEPGVGIETLAAALAREITAPDLEQEIIITASGARFVPRLRVEPRVLAPIQSRMLVSSPPENSNGSSAIDAELPTVRLGFQFPGQLRNLRWETAERCAPAAGEIEISVRATGVNFRDVMYALGLLSDEAVENGFAGPSLGLECAGYITAVGDGVRGFRVGDAVVAFGPSSLSNRVITKAGAASQIPAGISFEAAATIPSTFFTAYYALSHLARLEEGERVLIHGAAGGVGIAAIQLAKWMGAEIFVTAGSDEKRDFVRMLGADHVFDSRSNAFADDILAVTNGEGVDIVLNSLAGEAINRNLRVLKPFGRFLELGKRDFYENTKIGLRPFRNNISYFGIDADQLMQEQPALTQRLFAKVMALFSEGVLHPLPYQTFEADDVVDAFRYMQQARQIGKIVITYRNGIHQVHAPKPEARQLGLSASATYLVTGGLGGFGLKTAQWLVSRGARNLVLISRSGPSSNEAKAAVAELKAEGVRVHAAACDATDEKALAALFAVLSTEMPPLRGVVHAAVVIEDGLIRNTAAEQIAKVFAPKILGAQHLHRMTRHMKMDFFVMFSSATTLFGNPGQASYVAANAYLEALAAARRDAGLPATCIRWGAIDDVGFLARNQQMKEALESRMGGTALPSSVALNAMEEMLLSNRSGLGVMELDWRALNRFLPSAQSPKFNELATLAGDADSDDDNADDIHRLMEELSPDELIAAFRGMLKDEIGEILRISPEKIEDTRSLYDMGLDSLMGVELALAIESRFGIKLPVMALSESPTIAKLAEKIIGLLKGANPGKEVVVPDASAVAAADIAAQVQQAVQQHAADVDAKTIDQFAADIHSADGAKSGRMIH